MAVATRFVYDFDETSEGGKGLLGGKGAGLAEMTALGIPVPAGFTITSDASRDYLVAKELTEGLEAEIVELLTVRVERTGKGFGNTEGPLCVTERLLCALS